MPTKTVKTRIQNKHDTETNWESKGSFVPLAGEFIVYDAESVEDPAKLKVGDGTHTLEELPFLGSGTTLVGIEKPTIDDSSVITYDGLVKQYPVDGYNEGQMVREGTYEATNAGTYTVTFKLKEGYCWMDETVDDVTLTWEIVKRNVKIKLNDTEENKHIGVYDSFENTISITTDPENIPWKYTISTTDERIEVVTSDNTLSIRCNGSFDTNFRYSITITLEDTDNNETTTREISLFYAPSLNAYPWDQINKAILGSIENSISFDIGTTKKITLIPNARVYPSKTEAIETNVFVSEVFKHTENTEYEGEKEIIDGVVFSGFKDDSGNHTAITPEYDTIIKQLLPGKTTLSFDEGNTFTDEEGYVHYHCSDYELLCKFASQHRECSRPICVIDEERFEISEFYYDSENGFVSFIFTPQGNGYETYLTVDRNGYTTTGDNGTNDRDNISSITFEEDTYVDKYLFYALGCLFNTCSCDTKQSNSEAGRAFEWELPDSSKPNLTTKPKSIEIIDTLTLDTNANVRITRTKSAQDSLDFVNASLTVWNINNSGFRVDITDTDTTDDVTMYNYENAFADDKYKVLTSITSISGDTFSVFYVLEHVFVHTTATVDETTKPIYGTWIWDNSALLTYDDSDNIDFNTSIDFISGDNVSYYGIYYQDGVLGYSTGTPSNPNKEVVSRGTVLYNNLLVMKFGDEPIYISNNAYEFITTHAHAIHYGYAYELAPAYLESESFNFRPNFMLDSKSIGISVKDALEPSLQNVLSSNSAIDVLSLPYYSELSNSTTPEDRINRFQEEINSGIDYYTSSNNIASKDIVTNKPCYVHLYWHLDSDNYETGFGVDLDGHAVANLSHREFINTIEAQTAGITPMFILGQCSHKYSHNAIEVNDNTNHNIIYDECIFCGYDDHTETGPHDYNNYSVCRVCLHKCDHSDSELVPSYTYESENDQEHKVTASYGQGECSWCGAVLYESRTETYFQSHIYNITKYTSNGEGKHTIEHLCGLCNHKDSSFWEIEDCNTGGYNNTCSYCGYQTEPAPN